MRRINGKWYGLVVVAVLLGFAGTGCSWYDRVMDEQTLSVGNGAPTNYASAPVSAPAPARTYVQPNGNLTKEVGALRVELTAAQDAHRKAMARNGELEDALAEKDKQIKDLQARVAELEAGLKQTDADWQKRLADERNTLAAQQEEARKAMAREMANRIAEAEKARQAAPAIAGEYEVVRGDTLSTIAAACGITVKDLKAVNGLNSDTIRVGQKLKIPQPSR
jgi:LysM repeat protein